MLARYWRTVNIYKMTNKGEPPRYSITYYRYPSVLLIAQPYKDIEKLLRGISTLEHKVHVWKGFKPDEAKALEGRLLSYSRTE